jgi:hypothetical protein
MPHKSKMVVMDRRTNPLCLRHLNPMREDSQGDIHSNYSNPEVASYYCGTDGCNLNWERRLGYFTTASAQETFQFGLKVGDVRLQDISSCFLPNMKLNPESKIWRCATCSHSRSEQD